MRSIAKSLQDAIRNDQLENVKTFFLSELQNGNYDYYNMSYNKPHYHNAMLYLAIQNDAIEVVKWLIEEFKLDITVAVKFHKSELLDERRSSSDDPTVTPLTVAIGSNARKTVDFLMKEKNAKLTLTDISFKIIQSATNNWTCHFHLALEKGLRVVLKTILERHQGVVDTQNNTAMHLVLKYKADDLELVKLVHSSGGSQSIAIKNNDNETPLDVFWKVLKDNKFDEKYFPVFQFLILNQFKPTVSQLENMLNAGAFRFLNCLDNQSFFEMERDPLLNPKDKSVYDILVSAISTNGTEEQWRRFTKEVVGIDREGFMKPRGDSSKSPLTRLLARIHDSDPSRNSSLKNNLCAVLESVLQAKAIVSREDFKMLLLSPVKNEEAIKIILYYNPQLALVALDKEDGNRRIWERNTALHVFLNVVASDNYATSNMPQYLRILDAILSPRELIDSEDGESERYHADPNKLNTNKQTALDVFCSKARISPIFLGLLSKLIKAGAKIKSEYLLALVDNIRASTPTNYDLLASVLSGVSDFNAFFTAKEPRKIFQALYNEIVSGLERGAISGEYINKALFLNLTRLYYAKRRQAPEEKHTGFAKVGSWVFQGFPKEEKLAASLELIKVISGEDGKKHVDREDVVKNGELGRIYALWQRYSHILEHDTSLTPPIPTKLLTMRAGRRVEIDDNAYRTGNVTPTSFAQVHAILSGVNTVDLAAKLSTIPGVQPPFGYMPVASYPQTDAPGTMFGAVDPKSEMVRPYLYNERQPFSGSSASSSGMFIPSNAAITSLRPATESQLQLPHASRFDAGLSSGSTASVPALPEEASMSTPLHKGSPYPALTSADPLYPSLSSLDNVAPLPNPGLFRPVSMAEGDPRAAAPSSSLAHNNSQ